MNTRRILPFSRLEIGNLYFNLVVCIFKSLNTAMRILKSLNSTLFFLFLSLVTHGYNTQILITPNHNPNHQKKCISNPNLNKFSAQDLKDISYYRKNRSIGFEISILQSTDFISKRIFTYATILAPFTKGPYASFAITSNPKRGPPLA